jgi:IS1016C2 transposase (fragment)
LDESYFRGVRKDGRRGAVGKIVVWGILKCNGWVYTVIVDNAKSQAYCLLLMKKSCLTALFIQIEIFAK